MLCPACERGEASPCTYAETFNFREGRTVVVSDLEGWNCPHCDETVIDWDQAKRNQARINKAKANG